MPPPISDLAQLTPQERARFVELLQETREPRELALSAQLATAFDRRLEQRRNEPGQARLLDEVLREIDVTAP